MFIGKSSRDTKFHSMKILDGPHRLRQNEIASIVYEAILFRDQKEYNLFASTIMPNHIHMVFGPLCRNNIPTYDKSVGRNGIPTCDKPIFHILQSLKRHTARKCNQILGRSGSFWHDESYDHVTRDEAELAQTIWYVLDNPVKAGLIDSWEKWQWTYLKQGLL